MKTTWELLMMNEINKIFSTYVFAETSEEAKKQVKKIYPTCSIYWMKMNEDS